MVRTSLLNRVPAAVLSSPLHPLLSGKRLVLTFTGRRSGTRYSTPVNYLQRGCELLITTDSRWQNRVGADGTPQAADVRAEVTRGRVLVRIQLPDDAIAP